MNITNSNLPEDDVLFLNRIINWYTTSVVTKRVALIVTLLVACAMVYVFLCGAVYGTDELSFQKVIHFIFDKSKLWNDPRHQDRFAQSGVFLWEVLFRLPLIFIAVLISKSIIFKITMSLKDDYSIQDLAKIKSHVIEHVKDMTVTERQVDLAKDRLIVLVNSQHVAFNKAHELDKKTFQKKDMTSSERVALRGKIAQSESECSEIDNEVQMQMKKIKKKENLLYEKLFLQEGISFITQLINTLKVNNQQTEQRRTTVTA